MHKSKLKVSLEVLYQIGSSSVHNEQYSWFNQKKL